MDPKNAIEILLVEDNPNDVELTLRALEKHKLANKVHVVKDGEEALDYVYKRGRYKERGNDMPKVIFLDLKLPKVSGLEVLKELKADPKTKCIPVVVLTSSLEEKDMVKSYEFGVNSFINKPVEFDKFVDAVSELGLYWLILNKPPYKN